MVPMQVKIADKIKKNTPPLFCMKCLICTSVYNPGFATIKTTEGLA